MCMSRVNGWINTELAPNEKKISVTDGAKRMSVKLGQTVGGLRPPARESRPAKVQDTSTRNRTLPKRFYDASPMIPIRYQRGVV